MTGADGRIAMRQPGPHIIAVRPSRLLSLLIGFALLFAPLVGHPAMAATSSHAGMKADHCQPATDTDKAAAKPCCAAMCAMAAIVSPEAIDEPVFAQLPARAVAERFPREIPSEIATPPPRRG
jgi:hypothetical protein